MGSLISFSGFDGVGKSTQVKLLSKYLEDIGDKVITTEAMFGYFLLNPLIRALRSATGSPSGGPVKRNKNFLPKFWFILAFIDIWLGYLFKIKPLLNKCDYLIADRFYTDIWANLLYYGYLPSWAFDFFIHLLPSSNIAVMLLADPKEVLKREKEFPPSYYMLQSVIYKRMTDKLNFCVVNANQKPEVVFKDIKSSIVTIIDEKN
ncbi:MAG: hypothetical protein Q7R43_02950 [Candidatus Daviesbacteria bacterium]|nr:hypothetical protein [Candidatus Daviesbacteria bacterium]